ncbi:MAG TPA: hypothetical protein VFE55_20220 [Acidimicrobiia bacterium]|nr:hypothetical protein [Acidimicrobiia bacterium]
MVQDGSKWTTAVVKVEPVDDGYEVLLEDGDELVLAHYDITDCDGPADVAAARLAREDAERYAAEVRRLLGTGRRAS